jgi:Skp family chaperone for outer membrane proteins
MKKVLLLIFPILLSVLSAFTFTTTMLVGVSRRTSQKPHQTVLRNDAMDMRVAVIETEFKNLSKKVDDLSKKMDDDSNEKLSKKMDDSIEKLSKKMDDSNEKLFKKMDDSTEKLCKKMDDSTEKLCKKMDDSNEKLNRKFFSMYVLLALAAGAIGRKILDSLLTALLK